MLLQIDGVVFLTIGYLISLCFSTSDFFYFLQQKLDMHLQKLLFADVLQNIVFLKMSQNLQAKPVSLAFETIASVNCYFTV